MLRLKTSKKELWDDDKEEFIYTKPYVLVMEHSLLSISKWESKWCKTFLKTNKTREEELDYIRCMCLSNDIPSEIIEHLNNDELNKINEYINKSMTALKFPIDKKANNDVITSEVIYYWMIQLNIPFECQKWHLNRLLSLIRLVNDKNNPKKKSKMELMRENAILNAKRKAAMNSKG